MVRVWNLPVELLDRQRLLGEHVELHVIWNALMKKARGVKAGFQNHPQTLRFEDEEGMLVDRHNQQIDEMRRRGYNHQSPLLPVLIPVPFTYTESQYQEDLETLNSRLSAPKVNEK